MKIDTEILCGFIDGELDAQTAATVRAALKTDAGLRQEYEDLRRTVELVRGLPRVSAPPELAQTITAHAERDQLLGRTPPRPTTDQSRLYWGLSVAAGLLIGVAVGILGYHVWTGHGVRSPESAGSALVMKSEDRDLSELARAKKAPPPTQPGPSVALKNQGTFREESGEGFVAEAKSYTPIARSWPQKGELRPAEGQKLPLEKQVILNNFVNQDMAANLKFEVEPFKVKVVSNDATKTLQYVQQWAASNSLIDLNKAPARMNFPVYTQVVYQGQPGANIAPTNENGVLLRTTRSQARQIVSELQQQKPLVVSVSVKDEKNSLGLDVPGQQLAMAKAEPTLAKPPANEELRGQQAKPSAAPSAKSRSDYLFQITNQTQVQSLDDLVTLVVLVEDARHPVTTPPSSSTAKP